MNFLHILSSSFLSYNRQVSAFLVKTFGVPESEYQVALAKRSAKVYPVAGPWIQGGLIKALKNIQSGLEPPGSDDNEDNDGFATSLAAFLVAPEQAPAVAKLATTSPTALNHLTLQHAILSNYLAAVDEPIQQGGESVAADLPDLAQEVTDVLAAVSDSGKSVADLVEVYGKACPLPGSFMSACIVLLRCEDYVSAVRHNILSGGDCNARANFIGACLGARLGVESIPMEWIEKVRMFQCKVSDPDPHFFLVFGSGFRSASVFF